MKNTSLRILLSELVLCTFIVSNIVPFQLYAEEEAVDTSPEIVDATPVEEVPLDIPVGDMPESDPTVEPLPESEAIVPEVIEATSTGSSEIIPEATEESPAAVTPEPVTPDITLTGTVTEETEVIPIESEQVVPRSRIDEAANTLFPFIKDRGEKKIIKSQSGGSYIEGQILIKFKVANIDIDTSFGQYQLENIEKNNDLTLSDSMPEENIAILNIDEDTSLDIFSGIESVLIQDMSSKDGELEGVIENLKQDPRVEHIQKNYVYKSQTVNDPEFSKLWAMNNNGQTVNGKSGVVDADIDYPEAQTYGSGKLGTGIIVAILDTGISYNHPDLIGNLWNGNGCLSDTGALLGGCIHGYDFAYNDKDPLDGDSHGSHIAGTIGAVTNNGTGIVGIAPNVKLMAVKILDDDGYGSTEDVIRGIKFAQKNGAKVINASFGELAETSVDSDFDYLTYNAIRSFSGLFIAAAGNEGENLENLPGLKHFPSGFGSDTRVSGEVVINSVTVLSGTILIPRLPNVIAVAASDEQDEMAWFSNHGPTTVHIAAPGTSIYSTVMIQSGAMNRVSYESGWEKQEDASSQTWSTRSLGVVSGEYVELTGALWGDTRTPYVSGESSYIIKSYTGIDVGSRIEISAWCDTPTSHTWIDYMDVLVSTGGAFYAVKRIDEDILYGKSLYSTWIDGYVGEYAKLAIEPFFPISGDVDIAIIWRTTSNGQDNEGTHYGCALDKIGFSKMVPSYKFINGTSMATSHVSGAAALAWSYKPGATIEDIRNAILKGAEKKNSLLGLVQTSGRLNLLNTLKVLDGNSLVSQKVTLSGEKSAKIDVTFMNDTYSPKILFSDNKQLSHGISNSGNANLSYALALRDAGVISGELSASGYRLNTYMSRAETAMLVARIGGYIPTECVGDIFEDVDSSVGIACGSIEALAEVGIIPTNTMSYSPLGTHSRSEVITMLLLSLGESGSTLDAGYIDADNMYINRADELNCMEGGIYAYPDASALRGEVFRLASCISGLLMINRSDMFSQILDYSLASGNNYRFLVDNLHPNKKYFYKILTCINGGNCIVRDETVYEFRTAQLFDRSYTGSIVGSGALYLSGATATGILYDTGSTNHIILSDSGVSVTMQLPLSGLRITSSGAWDGILRNPELLSLAGTITLSGGSSTGVQSVHTIGGTGGVSLSLSGQVATISITILGQSGVTFPVYRTPDPAIPYIQIGTCVVTNDLCSFTTAHFSLFAVGAPVIVGGSSGGAVTGNGGGGGTYNPVGGSYGTIVFTPLQLNYISGRGNIIALATGRSPSVAFAGNILNLFQRNGMKSFLTGLAYDADDSPEEFSRSHITEPIISYIEESGYTRGQKLLMYDRVLTTLDKQIKKGGSDTGHTLSLTLARKDVLKERKSFIDHEFGN